MSFSQDWNCLHVDWIQKYCLIFLWILDKNLIYFVHSTKSLNQRLQDNSKITINLGQDRVTDKSKTPQQFDRGMLKTITITVHQNIHTGGTKTEEEKVRSSYDLSIQLLHLAVTASQTVQHKIVSVERKLWLHMPSQFAFPVQYGYLCY